MKPYSLMSGETERKKEENIYSPYFQEEEEDTIYWVLPDAVMLRSLYILSNSTNVNMISIYFTNGET